MLFRSLYNNPMIQPERIQKTMFGFFSGIKVKLKSKSVDPNLSLDCDHDVFHYLFKDRGYKSNVTGAVMLNKEDFDKMELPPSW